MQLADDNTFRPVNDEGTAISHYGHFSHKYFLFAVEGLTLTFNLHLEAKLQLKRSGIGTLALDTFHLVQIGITHRIADILQPRTLIIAHDWKDFPENSFQPNRLTMGRRNVLLNEIPEGINLVENKIGWLNNFLELSEILTIFHRHNIYY